METEFVVVLDGAMEYQDDWFELKIIEFTEKLSRLIKLEQQMYLLEQENCPNFL